MHPPTVLGGFPIERILCATVHRAVFWSSTTV